MKFSERASKIKPSATMAVGTLAKKLKAEGKPVLAFNVGEPDFVSPEAALKAGREAIDRGETHYTANDGIPELKRAVGDYYKRHFNLDFAPGEILIATGAKPLTYEAFQVLLDPGDEVIIPTPAWVSYIEQIRLAGGVEVTVDTSVTGFSPTREALDAAVSPRTKGILVNTPNNPSGVVYDEATIKMLADFVKAHDLWIIYDEILRTPRL